MIAPILLPVFVLAGWTLLVWAWMIVTRLPALGRAGVKLGQLKGGTGRDAERVVPSETQWIAHNYNHLHEAPTVFYAAALGLAVAGLGGGIGLWLAWAYVSLRIVHSLIQTLWNAVLWRFIAYVASQLVLAAMIAVGIAGMLT